MSAVESGLTGGLAIDHLSVEAAGARFHVARAGHGPVLLLLHGWPEFWLTWTPLMARLADRFTLLAPDLRGFGDSDKPSRDWAPEDHAHDMLALLDALGVERAGVVGHDVGSYVMQAMVRQRSAAVSGLFFFNCVYPGIGTRAGTPDRAAEIWYQSFHLLDMAVELVGSSREACRAYIGHFLRHWSHRRDAFEPMLEAFVDNFLKPGNLAGGFSHYRANAARRTAMALGEVPDVAPIDLPTMVRWGAYDPILLAQWRDRLGEYFTRCDAGVMEGVGHFPHVEDPEVSAVAIAGFFAPGQPAAP